MRTRTAHFALSLFVVTTALTAGASTVPVPPIAEKRPVETVMHGETLVDHYGWMRYKEDPEVIGYLAAENDYAEEMMSHTAALQGRLYDEFLGRIKQTDISVPAFNNGWWYSTRTEEGKDYPLYERAPGDASGPTGPEEIYLDQNMLAQEFDYLRITRRALDPSQNMLAFAVDTTGYETVDVWLKDLRTGTVTRNVLEDVAPFSLAWGLNGKTLYYARFDESKRTNRIYRHIIGTDPAADELLIREDDVRFSLSVGASSSDEWIVISSGSTTTSEVWILDASNPASRPRSVAGRTPGVMYSVTHRRGEGPNADGGERGWIYCTTDDGAPNFRVVRKRVDAGAFDPWDEVIPHDTDAYIRSVSMFEGHMVVSERRSGFTSLRVIAHASGKSREIETPEEVGVIGLSNNPMYDTDTIRFSYSSPVTPNSTYAYNMNTHRRTLLKQTEIPSGHDPDRYTVRRLYATADDGTRIPMSVVHRNEVKPDSDNPALLYAYGSYGASMDPRFSATRLSLLDRGFVFAIAHVRGGGEMGRHWKEDGRMEHKMNTFTDFIACAEFLIGEGYTRPERLAIQGGSAGGLLMGAAVNLRPDLFKACHAAVPFVDVINTMSDASIPLTTGEYEEWGNPHIEEQYRWIRAYSPYENVERKAYPAMLITAGLNDPRVHYWEPAKWAAKLRDKKTNDAPLLLKTNMGAGHGGSSGRYERLEEIAFEMAFFIDQLGAPEAPVH